MAEEKKKEELNSRILEELEDSEERLKLLFEYAPDAYYLSDCEGNFLDGNRAAEELVGYKREELIGKNLLKVNLLSPEHLTNAVKLVAKSILGQSTGPDELVLVRKDGSKVTVEIRTFPLKIAGKLTILGIARDVTERKRSEAAIRAEKDRAQEYLDIAAVILVAIGADQKVMRINKKGCDVLGYSEEEIVGANWFDNFLPKGDHEQVKSVFNEIIVKGGKVAEYYENPVLTKGGAVRLIAWHNSVLKDAHGKTIATISSGEDITERKRVEEELAHSEKRFKDVVEITSEYVWEMDVNGVSSYFSPGVEKILGYKPEEVVGKDLYFLWDPDERERQATEALEILKTGKPFKGFININRHKDGYKVILETSGVPMYDTDGKLIGYRGADRDVTERKVAEKALQESEERYRAMFESANDIIVTLDLGGRISSINRKIEDITGYCREDIVGKHISELRMFPPDSIKAMLTRFSQRAQGSSVPSYFVETIGSGGRQIFAEINGSSLMQDGKVVGLIVFIKDITARRRAESALRESEEQHRMLFENAGVGIGYYTPDGTVLGFNRMAVQNLGGRPEDYVGKSMVDVFGKEQGSRYMSRLNASASSSEALEFEDKVSLPTGMKWFASTYTRLCIDDKVTAIQIVSQDITDRMQASERLKQAADEWQKTFDSITDLIFIIDGDFKIIKVNAAFCAYMKAKPEDLIGKRCYEVMHKSDRPWPNCPQVKSIQDKTPHSEEVLDKEAYLFWSAFLLYSTSAGKSSEQCT
jgi:PAS domain S-box-containing protein